MFNCQHWKIKFVYIGFGSFFGCLCTIIGMLASPATAQKDKFREIECTKLTLIDPLTGKTTAELRTERHGALLSLYGRKDNRGGAKIAVSKNGGELIMFSNEKDGGAHVSAALMTSENGTGSVSVDHKNGGGVFITATDIGGGLRTTGPNHDKSLAFIGVTDDGKSGVIIANRYDHGKEIGSAELKANKNGGRLDVFGKVDNKSRAAVSINEYGNGVVSTWDKNGYRQ